MEKPRISIDSISSRAFTIMTVSSEEDPDITYVHRLYTPNMNDTEDFLVQIINTESTVVWSSLITLNGTDRFQITVPNQYLTGFTDLQSMMYYFTSCIKSLVLRVTIAILTLMTMMIIGSILTHTIKLYGILELSEYSNMLRK